MSVSQIDHYECEILLLLTTCFSHDYPKILVERFVDPIHRGSNLDRGNMALPVWAKGLRRFRLHLCQSTSDCLFPATSRKSSSASTSPVRSSAGSQESGSKPVRVFSGIQPTGNLHLGNYLGAVALWKNLQDSPDKSLIISVVDMHAITLDWKPDMLRKNIMQMFVHLMACGIEPQRSILFLQSMVPEHCQLQWIFSCLTTLTRIDNLPHFKEKSAPLQPKKTVEGQPPPQIEGGCGLLMYPILQAADILLYKSQLVPVGEDQIHHLQLAQHIARVFNNKHGKYFPYPQRLHSKPVCRKPSSRVTSPLTGEQPRVKSLRDPLKKMSKSDVDAKSRIDLTDPPDQILSKFMKAVTDSVSRLEYDPENRPGLANLISLYQTVTERNMETVQGEIASLDKVQFKTRLADAVIEMLKPIQAKITDLNKNLDFVERCVTDGSRSARSIAQDTMREVFDLVGFKTMSLVRSPVSISEEKNDGHAVGSEECEINANQKRARIKS